MNETNASPQRRHPRLAHRAKIKVILPADAGFFFTDMRDFSESGLFLFCSADTMPTLGTIVEVQTTEFEDAPIQAAKVVRIEADTGFGLEFVRQ